MEMSFSDEDTISQSDLESEIGNYITEKKIESASLETGDAGQDQDLDYYKKLLQT